MQLIGPFYRWLQTTSLDSNHRGDIPRSNVRSGPQTLVPFGLIHLPQSFFGILPAPRVQIPILTKTTTRFRN